MFHNLLIKIVVMYLKFNNNELLLLNKIRYIVITTI